jgi:epoxyqueuosine reductase
VSLSEKIKSFALEAGADLVGIAPAFVDEIAKENLREFVEAGRQGEMKYLENTGARANPEMVLAGAKSVIVIAVNYGGMEEEGELRAQPAARTGTAAGAEEGGAAAGDSQLRAQPAAARGFGKIARYAYGRDYHKVLRGVLKKIIAYIKKIHPEGNLRACVDSAPLLEKNYAVTAGLGFIGKNTTLITKEFGSYVVLGEIVADFALDYDGPAGGGAAAGGRAAANGTGGYAAGTCGTCTRCLDACPTLALIGPKKMDARRCISYLTIEKKGEIPTELAEKMGNRIFGCDTCQEVCPYNLAAARTGTGVSRRSGGARGAAAGDLQLRAQPAGAAGVGSAQPSAARRGKNPDFHKAIAGSRLDLKEILAIKDDESYQARFAGSPLMRAKREGLQRNARIAMGNEDMPLR